MSETANTTSTLDNLLQTYFVKEAMDRLLPKAVFYQFATKTPLPKGGGKTVRWNAWSNFAPVTGALSNEYTNPDAKTVSSRKVEATVQGYGRSTLCPELLELTSSLDVIKGTVENLTDSAGLSVDRVLMTGIFKDNITSNLDANILSAWMSCLASGFHAGSNSTNSLEAWAFPVVFATTASRLSAAANTTATFSCHMSFYAIRKAVRQLKRMNAMEFADGNFAGVANSDTLQDLTLDPDFKEWNKYTSAKMGQNSLGPQGPTPVFQAANVTWYQSNTMPKYRATHSCDLAFIFGKGAFGSTGFNTNGQKGFEVIITRSGPQSTNDPLNLKAYVSYKFYMAAACLNPSAGRTLVVTSKSRA